MSPESEVLTVSTTVHGDDRAVVSLTGELDVDTAVALQHQLAALVLQGRKHVVLDLAQVPFMDSSGLNSILRARSETQRYDGNLLLAAPGSAVRRLLDLTGVSLTSPLYATVGDALASLAGAEPAS
ncbi:STAS domain-containing protein [Streptacidiphilus sp. PB12-B1b]|uniref:STAS domain-containing protein n=1 Tax=Streptacidiphilus sp. PB12-B1b TaxID=2705012 RepID=UPI0015F7C376|nr:STAS domain-containing protein [Streptacidiphilus sp. PB12-B1b]QMU77111.1 STAS domain-containing protein [Streptacidiphilus sp. PB12-B1b]